MTTLSRSEIEQQLLELDQSIKKFKEELFRISWYMRGGVSVNDLMHIYSYEDRMIFYEIIKDNLELTKASRMPLL